MVVKSPERGDSAKSAISNGELSPKPDGVEPHLVVPGGSPAKLRRTSARIQGMQRAEELRGKSQVDLSDGEEEDVERKKRKRNGYARRNGISRKRSHVSEGVVENNAPAKLGLSVEAEVAEVKDVPASLGLSQAETDGDTVNSGGDVVTGNGTEKSDYAKVKDTLRLFNKHYLQLVQEEEKRCSKEEHEQNNSKISKPKKGKSNDGEVTKKTKQTDFKAITEAGKSNEGDVKKKAKAKRPDLKAITKMMETNTILHSKKQIGEIPGISVGHQFFSRAEMVVVGFHSHWLNGIDYMGQLYQKEYRQYTFPIAVAIVLSGMYEDDLDNADDVVYTGQGGHDLLGSKHQIGDQKMERGNLALKNAMEQSVPVRVIRGHISRSSYCGRVYTYDGLYKVVKYWAEKGLSGFTVFKYSLRRLEGQPILTTNQVHFTNGRVPESVSDVRGLVCEDISGGLEELPIPATNLVDVPPVPPTGSTYRKAIKVAPGVKIPSNATGCNCIGTCYDSKKCSCARLNGSDFPYVLRDGGRLIEAKDVVYECGPGCGCGPDCVNRTSQKGIRHRLEVFRTPKKGWAVRSWDFIPAGSPVCEYVGILRRADDVESATENYFIFDIDCLQTMRGLEGRERRSKNATLNDLDGPIDPKSESGPEYCIDAGSTGNVARYINHSCGPNLFVQCVLSSHHDMKLARVVLFAADNIPPLQELTYDYGYALDSVLGPDGKVKQMACYCGAADCRKRMF